MELNKALYLYVISISFVISACAAQSFPYGSPGFGPAVAYSNFRGGNSGFGIGTGQSENFENSAFSVHGTFNGGFPSFGGFGMQSHPDRQEHGYANPGSVLFGGGGRGYNRIGSGYRNYMNNDDNNDSFEDFDTDDPQPRTMSIPIRPKITKHVSIHVAPEEPPPPPRMRSKSPAPEPQKHYNIIFIKAPSSMTAELPEITLPPPPEQKTLVYLLIKKPDMMDMVRFKPAVTPRPSKPEVYFIRYKDKGSSTKKQKDQSKSESIATQFENQGRQFGDENDHQQHLDFTSGQNDSGGDNGFGDSFDREYQQQQRAHFPTSSGGQSYGAPPH